MDASKTKNEVGLKHRAFATSASGGQYGQFQAFPTVHQGKESRLPLNRKICKLQTHVSLDAPARNQT